MVVAASKETLTMTWKLNDFISWETIPVFKNCGLVYIKSATTSTTDKSATMTSTGASSHLINH